MSRYAAWQESDRLRRRALVWLVLGATALTIADSRAQPAAEALPADHPPLMKAGTTAAPRLAPDTVLARVDGDRITAGDLDATIGALRGPDRFEYNSPEAVRDLLEALIDQRLMARAARAAGMDGSRAPDESLPDQIPPAGAAADAALAEAWLARELAALKPPGERDVEQYYREHAAEFTVPARVQVTRVVAATPEAAASAREELARGASAAELRTRAGGQWRGVEVLWLQDTAKKPETVAVALGLKKGQVSGVVPVAAGFMVLRAEQSEAARLRPLAEVRTGIAAGLEAASRQQAEAELRRRLRASARVTILEEPLMSYSPPLSPVEQNPVR